MKGPEHEHLLRILEACFAAIEAGQTPDLGTLCGRDEGLIARVSLLLERERTSLLAARDAGQSLQPRADAAPKRLGEFVLLEPLGVGGMSTVYRARQESLQRDVALKLLRPELVDSDTGRLRFQREATITASLQHPHIVPVYAAGEVDGHVFLAMRFLRGQSLERQPAPMSPQQVADLGIAIAKALQAAHDIGVVHRDVKPANIVVEHGVPFLVDFGLSSFAHSAGTITRPDSTPGTLIYLAPELARRHSGGLDPRVDVYGLGATLYEALAGRPPFEAATPIQVLHQILHSEPKPLRLPAAARDLETIVIRAMAKEPARRFQTAAELASELMLWRDGRPIRSRRAGIIERCARWARRRPLLAAMSAAVMLLAVGLGWVLWQQASDRRLRWRFGAESVSAAVAAGDVAAAERELTAIAPLAPDEVALVDLQRDISAERDTADLIAALHSPITHQDASGLRELVATLSRNGTRAKARHADLALAVATRLLNSDPLSHSPLDDATRRAWPRAVAAVGAWSLGRSVVEAIANEPPSVEPYEALFTALALRLKEDPAWRVERELRAVVAMGPAADVMQYALSWVLEAAGQGDSVEARVAGLSAAYDLANRLRERGGLALAAEMQCARLSAAMGDSVRARTHLRAATAAVPPQWRVLQGVSELEVLLEIDPAEFSRRWQALKPELSHLPHFWLKGAYAAAMAEDRDAAMLDEVGENLTQALSRARRNSIRQDIELAILMLDYERIDLGGDPGTASASAAWSDLSRRCEAYASSVRRTEAGDDLRSDGMLLAARAGFAAGERARAWRLLDTTASEFASTEVHAHYAYLVANRILEWHTDETGQMLAPGTGTDPDAETEGPLDAAAGKALLRARSVMAIGETPATAGQLREARLGALLSAFHLGEPAITLPIVCDWPNDPEDAALVPIVACCRAEGGLRLDQWLPDGEPLPVRTATRLLDALNTLQKLQVSGKFPAADVRAVLARWRARPAFQATAERTESDWQAVWQRLRELEAVLPAK